MSEEIEEINKEEIAKKLEALKANMSEKIEEKKKPKVSKKTLFLREIGSVIKEKYDDGISYVDISKSIYEIFNFKVNEQEIRSFAHKELGIPKKPRNKKKADATAVASKDKVLSSDKKESAHEMKKRIANEAPKEGELTL